MRRSVHTIDTNAGNAQNGSSFAYGTAHHQRFFRKHRSRTSVFLRFRRVSEYGFRDYVPDWGRWLSVDPSGERGTCNLFRAFRNASLSFIDPDGRSDIPVPGNPLDTLQDMIRAIQRAVELGQDVANLVDQLARAVDDAIARATQPIRDLAQIRSDLERLRQEGHTRFPGTANSCIRHCWASCESNKRYGAALTRVSGVINEIQGLLRWDIPNLWDRLTGRTQWAFQISDLIDNETGIGCASHPSLDCVACCQCACTPPPSPVPLYPYPLPIYPGPDSGNAPPVIVIGPVPILPLNPDPYRRL